MARRKPVVTDVYLAQVCVAASVENPPVGLSLRQDL